MRLRLVPILVTSFVLSLGLSACGSSSKDESYTYDYTENKCATGKHTFSEKGPYCAALLNDALNNNCAKQSRLNAHKFSGC